MAEAQTADPLTTVTAGPEIGYSLTGRLREARQRLAGRGLRPLRLDGRWYVLPTGDGQLDDLLSAAEGGNGAAALAALDRLREHHQAEPCDTLRQWADALQYAAEGRHLEELRQRVARREESTAE